MERRTTTKTEQAFGTLLRSYRIRAGYSQETLAERAHLSASAIGLIERGVRRAPYRQTIDMLAGALDLTSEDRQHLVQSANQARARPAPASQSPVEPLDLLAPLTSFIERPEVAELASIVRENRLVTITGSGGVGKTRTAVEAVKRIAHRREDVCFVDLSHLNGGERVSPEIAASMKLPVADGDDYIDTIKQSLSDRTLLLVIDNCEHVIAETAAIAHALLQAAPALTILITSREPLGLSNEIVYRLPPLAVPDRPLRSADEMKDYASLELLLARTATTDARLRAVLTDFETMAAICRELEGIPLAIELAAFHLPFLGPATLLARLREGFMLSGKPDLPERQQTMAATIAWSFNLLDGYEQELLARLSVFSGGFTLDAAEHVCADGLLPRASVFGALSRLAQKSLVSVRHYHLQTRYVLLESVRAFALAQLRAAGNEEPMRRSHLQWMLDVAKAFADRRPRQPPDTLFAELENIRGAIAWGTHSSDVADAVAGGTIAGGLRLVWFALERPGELRALAQNVLERLSDDEYPGVVGQVCVAISNAYTVRDPEKAVAFGKRAVSLLVRAGDNELAASVSMQLAVELAGRGRFDEAEEVISSSSDWIDRQTANTSRPYLNALYNRATLRKVQSRFDLARADLAKLLASIDNASDPDNHFRIYGTVANAENEFGAGNRTLAVAIVTDVIDRFQSATDEPRIWMAVANANLAGYHLLLGNADDCSVYAKAAIRIAVGLGYEPFPEPILYLAGALALSRQLDKSATLLGYVDAAYQRLGYDFQATDALCRTIVSEAISALPPETRMVRAASGANSTFAEIAARFG